MKLLFITTKGDWGGSEPLWCETAEKALTDGHEVTVVVPQVQKMPTPIESLAQMGAGIALRPPPLSRTLFRRIRWKLLGIREPEMLWWKSRFPKPFNAICVSQGGAYCVMNMPGLANWLMDIETPFVLVGHSHRAYALPAGELRVQIRRLFEKADKVCLVAQDHVRAVGRFLGMELRNAVVVQNPVNLPEAGRFAPEDRRSDIGDRGEAAVRPMADDGGLMAEGRKLVPSSATVIDSDFLSVTSHSPLVTATELPLLDSRPSTLDSTSPVARMACVARFEVRDKGQDLLLEALGDPVWQERDFRLDFFGSGPDREILEDLISFYSLGDKVRIVGFESDIRKIWEEHGLLVLPSLSEGTPISLIEAQLCGRAALVTRVDGIPDWVEDGQTGFLAEAPTVHHLRLALERAWENRHRWREMGEAARGACLAKRDPNPAGFLLSLLCETADQAKIFTN